MRTAEEYTMNKQYDLSILIPARNEEFLSKTIQDMLENIEGNTEIIAVLDGVWAKPGIPDHNDVRVAYLPESVGQRAATNIACKLSKAKYVMKADAHTAWDKGFDVKMLEAFKKTGDNVTMAPLMKNLHAFDWVCEDGHRRYQGPSGPCKDCGKPTTKDMLWFAKPSPQSTAFRFDTNMHFQYHNEWKKKQEGDIVETLSLQGSCFMLTREKYWELNISDETWGSWGQQGVEVACKTWLSGGRVLINKNTYYAHLFRTQGGDFSFPYKQRPESEIIALREFTKDLFMNNKWPLATKTFQWLLDKFGPLPGWHDDKVDVNIGDMENTEIPDANQKGIIYYTDNRLNVKLAKTVQKQLQTIGLPIISASLKPMIFGDKNIMVEGERGYETYFKQIIAALEQSQAKYVFFCEHDVLYHPSHFEFTPPKDDTFYYNTNVWRLKYPENKAVTWEANQVAELVCNRELALDWYRKKLKEYQTAEKFNRKFEPEDKYEQFKSKEPNIDIRHDKNLTRSKWSIDDFRDKKTAINFREGICPGWAKDKLGL